MNKTLKNLTQNELVSFEEEMNNIIIDNVELNNNNVIIHYTCGARLIITAQKELQSDDMIKAVLNCEFDE